MRETGIEPGKVAPSFTLPTHEGERRSLAEFLARGPLLLAFHRGTW
jgi:peroxiredoxin